MSISQYIKIVGRGSKGANDLSRIDAQVVMTKILDRTVTDLELGAFCMAMRIKGESGDELAGFYDAIKPRLPSLIFSRPVLLLPSYNCARKTHLMTPLLAKWMSERGYIVLIHGMNEEVERTSSEQLFKLMGWPIAHSQENLQDLLYQHRFAYCSLSILCPALSALLCLRSTIGVRNSGHILAKLINPVHTLSLQIYNYTHPIYPILIEDFFNKHPGNFLSMRGHEGEPVASPRRMPEFNGYLFHAKERWDSAAEYELNPVEYPSGIDPASTKNLYKHIFSGVCQAPQTLLMQVNTLDQALKKISTSAGVSHDRSSV